MVKQAEPGSVEALGKDELVALVHQLQAQVRELIEENEALRAGDFWRGDEPALGESQAEARRRLARDPLMTTRRRPAGPVPPFEPIGAGGGTGKVDVLRLLGKRGDDWDGTSDD